MSDLPSVIVNSTDTEDTAYVKQIHSDKTDVYNFSLVLAQGKRHNNCNLQWPSLNINFYEF